MILNSDEEFCELIDNNDGWQEFGSDPFEVVSEQEEEDGRPINPPAPQRRPIITMRGFK